MENIDHNNTLIQEGGAFQEYEFQFNFINMPWDERTRKSKFGIVLLLLAIFLATFACVINSFLMHYRGVSPDRKMSVYSVASHGTKCQLVRIEDFKYVARIHSLNTQELICVGAVISESVVLANGACVKNRQVRLHVGSPTDIRCKNGFAVHTVETMIHEGVIARKLVLLITNQNMLRCAKVIQFGTDIIHKHARAFVIGRTLHGNAGRSMSGQPVEVMGMGMECSCQGLPKKRQPNIICVKTLTQCPVLAGDLLIQGGLLYGLASTSLYRQEQFTQACFADLKTLIRDFLKNNDDDNL